MQGVLCALQQLLLFVPVERLQPSFEPIELEKVVLCLSLLPVVESIVCRSTLSFRFPTASMHVSDLSEI